MRNILLITFILLTQTCLGQKFFDVSFHTPSAEELNNQVSAYDPISNTIVTSYFNVQFFIDTTKMFYTNVKYNMNGNILNQYTYKPATHDTLFEITLLKNIRDTIRCFGNMRVKGSNNYLFNGYFNADMSIQYTNLYQYPHNDSNRIVANCIESLYGSFYLFTMRHYADTSVLYPYATAFVFKLDINNFDSLKLTQIAGNGNDTQSVGAVTDCFAYNGKFKCIIQRRWDSINYLNKAPTLLFVPKIYNFDTNFLFVKNQIKYPWTMQQLNKDNSYHSVTSFGAYRSILKFEQSYISPTSLNFKHSNAILDKRGTFGILKMDLDNDTIYSIHEYPVFNKNDSTENAQIIEAFTNIVFTDKNHIVMIGQDQKVVDNRYVLHIDAIDSNLNIKWQKFILKFDTVLVPRTISLLPNNGVVVTGLEISIPFPYIFKPLIFSLDSTGNLAPTSTSQISKGTISLTVFPNPAAQQLNFKFDNQIKGTIKIQNLEGKTIQTQAINYPNTNINLHNLPSGVYIYTISSENEIILSNQFIKQ